jgi:predicted SAM-dependent methyltransferase
MRINFACGKNVWDGWYNIDAVARDGAKPDLIYAMQFDKTGSLIHPMPLPDCCADELLAAHILEHFYFFEAVAVITEWKRVIKPGGLLVLELPNLELAARNLLDGRKDNMTMWPLYGDPTHVDPYMCHRWGYTPTTIRALLTDAGFDKIKFKDPQTHMKRADRDMRVEARKP